LLVVPSNFGLAFSGSWFLRQPSGSQRNRVLVVALRQVFRCRSHVGDVEEEAGRQLALDGQVQLYVVGICPFLSKPTTFCGKKAPEAAEGIVARFP